MSLATSPPGKGRKSRTAEQVRWDAECPGLGLRIRPSGVASWIVQRRVDGRLTKTTLGRADAIDRELARSLARASDAESATTCAATHAAALPPTLAAFAERFLADCAGRWKLRTVERHRLDLVGRILPSLGARRVDLLTADDVMAWRNRSGARAHGGSDDRSLAVLSGMMRHAEALGLRLPGSNPCRGLRRRKTSFEGRALTAPEWSRLGRALAVHADSSPLLVAMVRLIAFTGCRRGEVAGLQWDWVQHDRVLLPDSKSGPRTVWLGIQARALLASLPRTGSPLVFPGTAGRSLVNPLMFFWRRVRREADLAPLRLHDLRHSFATVAIESGENERVVADLLGHADLVTMSAYVHLADDAIAQAAERVGAHLAEALQSQTGARTVADREAPKTPNRAARRKPKRVATKAAAPPAVHSAIRRFVSGRFGLAEFCAREGLDEMVFRAAVIAWRRQGKTQKRGRAA